MLKVGNKMRFQIADKAERDRFWEVSQVLSLSSLLRLSYRLKQFLVLSLSLSTSLSIYIYIWVYINLSLPSIYIYRS